MKKSISQLLIIAFGLCFCVPSIEAAASSDTVKKSNAKVDSKYEIMKINQNSGTDTLAIPFDDSEVEDEEQIDRLEKKETFPVPTK